MSLWQSDSTHGPKWAPSVRTPRGWEHAVTGELLVAFADTSFVLPSAASTIASVKLDRGRKKYKTGDVIKLLVQFTEPVVVTGTPQIPLTVGAKSAQLNYVAREGDNGTGSAELLFEYPVVAGDSATASNVSVGTAAVKATKNILTTNAGITYTAVAGGTGGNAITIAYVVAGNSTALTVAVVSNAITVNVATDSGGAATSTATLVLAAVHASTPAAALVNSVLVGTGASVVSAVTATALTGGLAGTSAISLNSGTIKDFGSTSVNSTLTLGAAAPDLSAVTVN